MNVDAPKTTVEQAAVMATVSYADVFDMPIELTHLHRFLVGASCSIDEIALEVDALTGAGHLERRGDVVHLPGRSEVLAIYDDRTERAATMWSEAERWGRRMAQLPFVRMVSVTGGLAVDSVAPHDDIDYFVVTAPRRLWLTRLMIIALGRLAARDAIELCPNFLVTDRTLEMETRTVYVARELAQMTVISGDELCRKVRGANSWMFDFLPNATIEGDRSHLREVRRGLIQRIAERMLLARPFDRLERWEMDRKVEKLTRNASRRPEVGTPDESSFSPDVCKGHVVGNAAGIEAAWKQRLEA